MEAEFQTETAFTEVVHALSPIAHNDHIFHKNSSEGVVTDHTQIKFSRIEIVHGELSRAASNLAGDSRHPGPAVETTSQQHRTLRPHVRRRRRQSSGLFTSSNSIRRRKVEETPEGYLNKEHYRRFMEIGVVVVPQMSGSSEELKNLSLCLLGALFAVYAMEFWVMPSCKAKWKVTIFRIAYNSIMLIALYLLICILKPGWLSWYGFVMVCIIATACTCSYELNVTSQNASSLYQDIKTKFTWCCEKGDLVINYVIDKVSKPLKDQVTPASAPPRASV